MTLTWDDQSEVDSYVLLQTLPNSDNQPVDPPTNELRLRVETADEYCYQLEAVREGAANSAPSDPPACATTTLPPDAARPTASPTIDVIPPEGGGEPTTDPPTTSSDDNSSHVSDDSVPTPADDPSEFVAELAFSRRASRTKAAAETPRQKFFDAGIPAEILNTDEWVLEPQTAEPGTLIYLDGANAGEATSSVRRSQGPPT